jgi:hypothetical protein
MELEYIAVAKALQGIALSPSPAGSLVPASGLFLFLVLGVSHILLKFMSVVAAKVTTTKPTFALRASAMHKVAKKAPLLRGISNKVSNKLFARGQLLSCFVVFCTGTAASHVVGSWAARECPVFAGFDCR